MKPEIKIVFDTQELKDEFIGWMSDGGGEQSFNMLEWVADFKYSADDTVIEVKTPTN